jgi:hypothetical protein
LAGPTSASALTNCTPENKGRWRSNRQPLWPLAARAPPPHSSRAGGGHGTSACTCFLRCAHGLRIHGAFFLYRHGTVFLYSHGAVVLYSHGGNLVQSCQAGIISRHNHEKGHSGVSKTAHHRPSSVAAAPQRSCLLKISRCGCFQQDDRVRYGAAGRNSMGAGYGY